jgi:hypothetical protein
VTLFITFKRIFDTIRGKDHKELTIVTTEKWDHIADLAERNFQRLNDECHRLSKEFIKVIPDLVYDSSWEKLIKAPSFYRIVNPAYKPYAVSGSLSDGGRMNIGGSQNGPFRISEFTDLCKKQGALYVCSSWETAVWETFGRDADFNYAVKQIKAHSNKKVHEFTLTRSHEIIVIDFEAAYRALQPTFRLDYFFAITSDMNGSWPDLKAPAPIQLFAAWLMKNSPAAKGLEFLSTVDLQGGTNYALYFVDDHDASQFLQGAAFVIP